MNKIYGLFLTAFFATIVSAFDYERVEDTPAYEYASYEYITPSPTRKPVVTRSPSKFPTKKPTRKPTEKPTRPTKKPSKNPTPGPTRRCPKRRKCVCTNQPTTQVTTIAPGTNSTL